MAVPLHSSRGATGSSAGCLKGSPGVVLAVLTPSLKELLWKKAEPAQMWAHVSRAGKFPPLSCPSGAPIKDALARKRDLFHRPLHLKAARRLSICISPSGNTIPDQNMI